MLEPRDPQAHQAQTVTMVQREQWDPQDPQDPMVHQQFLLHVASTARHASRHQLDQWEGLAPRDQGAWLDPADQTDKMDREAHLVLQDQPDHQAHPDQWDPVDSPANQEMSSSARDQLAQQDPVAHQDPMACRDQWDHPANQDQSDLWDLLATQDSMVDQETMDPRDRRAPMESPDHTEAATTAHHQEPHLDIKHPHAEAMLLSYVFVTAVCLRPQRSILPP